MSRLLWWCCHLDKRIDRYENKIAKLQEWIDKDKKMLKEDLKRLSTSENIDFGISGWLQTGDLPHPLP